MGINDNITRITTSVAAIISTFVALLIPVGYGVISHRYQMGTLETEAEINSKLVSGLINANPELWRYETDRIVELLDRRPRSGHAETRRIFDTRGTLIAESVNTLKKPLVKASHEILDAGKPVGRIEISRSLLPLLHMSGLMVLVGLGLGLLVFRLIPLRAVTLAGKKLQDANDFLGMVMESSTNAIVVLDHSGSIRMTNRRFGEISSFRSEELCGRPFSSLFSGDAWSRIVDGINNVLMGTEARVMFETELSRQDGQTIRLVCGVAPLARQGNGSGLVLSLEDITERKRIEEALRDKNTELERFSYTVSHDLKSPLITIQTFSGQVLQDFNAGDHTYIRDDLQRISDAASKMMYLLDDLLELSRVGKMMNPPMAVDMGSLVGEVLKQLAGPLNLRQVEVVVQPDLSTVKGDQVRIAEVVQNLLENAIKYMGEQPRPCIEIGTRRDGRERVYFIRDNGEGIDPLFHEKIFELFKQLHEKGSGTGVGLALVKRIIDVHGGRIWVESEGAGMGSTFCFTLPEGSGPADI